MVFLFYYISISEWVNLIYDSFIDFHIELHERRRCECTVSSDVKVFDLRKP